MARGKYSIWAEYSPSCFDHRICASILRHYQSACKTVQQALRHDPTHRGRRRQHRHDKRRRHAPSPSRMQRNPSIACVITGALTFDVLRHNVQQLAGRGQGRSFPVLIAARNDLAREVLQRGVPRVRVDVVLERKRRKAGESEREWLPSRKHKTSRLGNWRSSRCLRSEAGPCLPERLRTFASA